MTGDRRVPAIMVQGTGSHVGKSLIVAGLCRAFANRGLRVAPFKPQNMSNNAGVADDGGEIGRAQMLQARAARVAPSVHMNPVLLKPETDIGAQVVVQGKRWATLTAREYGQRKSELLPRVIESFETISENADIIVVEGAGSPAETNLRAGDIANMGFAEAADVPVVLVGDIERGGVIAALVGTHAVLNAAENQRIRGFIVNRFRGDISLFAQGVAEIETRTGWTSLGIVPHFADASRLPAEDVLGLSGLPRESSGSRFRIAVPRLPRIANFDDLDPLAAEPEVAVLVVDPGEPIPQCDLILLPGSKSTIADLAALRREGWDIDILAHRRRGGAVLGLCGGYQMLGRSIADPDGIEGAPGDVTGLGLLDVDTVLTSEKRTIAVRERTPPRAQHSRATRFISAAPMARIAGARFWRSTAARRGRHQPTAGCAAAMFMGSSQATISAAHSCRNLAANLRSPTTRPLRLRSKVWPRIWSSTSIWTISSR